MKQGAVASPYFIHHMERLKDSLKLEFRGSIDESSKNSDPDSLELKQAECKTININGYGRVRGC